MELPADMKGAGGSDVWSFWQIGVPAVVIPDSAAFRYPYYRSSRDTPDKLDYTRMARVVAGLDHVIDRLALVRAAGGTRDRPPLAAENAR